MEENKDSSVNVKGDKEQVNPTVKVVDNNAGETNSLERYLDLGPGSERKESSDTVMLFSMALVAILLVAPFASMAFLY